MRCSPAFPFWQNVQRPRSFCLLALCSSRFSLFAHQLLLACVRFQPLFGTPLYSDAQMPKAFPPFCRLSLAADFVHFVPANAAA
jgi:hypothetical protein